MPRKSNQGLAKYALVDDYHYGDQDIHDVDDDAGHLAASSFLCVAPFSAKLCCFNRVTKIAFLSSASNLTIFSDLPGATHD